MKRIQRFREKRKKGKRKKKNPILYEHIGKCWKRLCVGVVLMEGMSEDNKRIIKENDRTRKGF